MGLRTKFYYRQIVMKKFLKEGEQKPMINYEVIGNSFRLSQTSIDKLPYDKHNYLLNFINGVFIVNT